MQVLTDMPLSKEDKTVKSCIPILTLLPSWDSLYADSNEGSEERLLHPNLCVYLETVSGPEGPMAIGIGPRNYQATFIKPVN